MKPSSESVHSMAGDFRPARSWIDRLSGNPRFWPSLAATMLLALLILSFYTWKVHHEQTTTLAQFDILQAEMTSLQVQYQDLQRFSNGLTQQLRERESQIALFANATRIIALEGTEDAPQARGTFHVGATTSVLVLQGLPALRQDEIYQLWLIPSSGNPIAVGPVPVDEGTTTTINFELSEEMQAFAAVGISIEPTGGSSQPTGPIVLLGTVTESR